MNSQTQAAMQQVRQWLEQAKHVAVLTGAGVSAESGVPTFRDTQKGYWAEFDVQDMASVSGYRSNPARVWQWYSERRELMLHVQPNPGHTALASYAQQHPGKLTLVTQNVDGLHERAGSPHVIALHGELMGNCWLNDACPMCDAQAALSAGGQPPQCSACGNMLRPAVVWFGENLPAQALQDAEAAAQQCDLMLAIGTTGAVYPAAGLVFQAHQRGAKIVIINPDDTEFDGIADVCLKGTSAQILPELFL